MSARKKVTFGIAEDEPIENDAMKLFIESSFPEAEVIWQCSNGQRAWEKIREQAPDVLIADIEMPLMNGLALCRLLYDSGYPGVILISTAFDKFEYTRRAIQLKVFDYMLKPMDDGEMRQTLEACMAEACRREEHWQEKPQKFSVKAAETAEKAEENAGAHMRSLSEFTFSMLIDGQENEKKTEEFFHLLGWDPEAICAFALQLSSGTPLESQELKALEDLTDELGQGGFWLLSDYPDREHFQLVLQPKTAVSPSEGYTKVWVVADLLRGLFPEGKIYVSPLCHTLRELTDECRRGEMPPGNWVFPEATWRQIRRRDARHYASLLERHLRERNRTKLLRLTADRDFGQKAAEAFDWEMAKLLLESIRVIWPALELSALEKELLSPEAKPRETMRRLVELCIRQPQNQNDDMLSAIWEWMEKDFAHDLTQAAVAERFGMDPAYFSRLFKKRTGKNFSEAMTDIRMRHAQQMLAENPRLTLEELCDACGLASKSYFSEVFKKWKGMTITQYLESLPK